ncbi:Vesicle transport v-SNARE protein [Aureococcus anophagefferens]|nr:Vesicle transport v-SNARE protein [Aureococcus anophagefferens]
MFAQYKDELGHVLRQSAEKLSVAGGYADDPARALDLLRECDGLLGQAGDLAKQLDVEVRSAPPNDKKALQDEAAPLRETLKTLQQSARDARAAAERRAVLGGGVSDASAGSRGRLADANARAQQQTDLIRGALEIAHDTEQVAVDISGELERNRETIGNIRGHIADTSGSGQDKGDSTSGSLGAARGLISSMQKREVQQKAILTVVAAILIGAVGAVSYYSFN